MSKTVQDILNELEIEEVVNAVLSDNAPAEEKAELTNALARLKEMEVADGNDSVMIGVCHKDNGTGENKVHYYTGNIRNFDKNDEFENVTFDQIDENAGIFAKELLEKNIVPVSDAMAFQDWEDVIGASVAESNVDKYGKLQFIADIISELTFLGYDEEALEEVRAGLKAFSEDTKKNGNKTFEEMKATPEGAHHLLSGIGLNDKSEEKELAKIQATKDVLKEKIVEYQHILDVLENL